MIEMPTIGFDGTDEIIFSQSFNVYENSLTINFLSHKFKFVFETNEPAEGQKDINANWSSDNKGATVIFSKKFRNSLGSGSTQKISVLKTGDGKEIFFSIFGQQVGADGFLHVTVSFYQR